MGIVEMGDMKPLKTAWAIDNRICNVLVDARAQKSSRKSRPKDPGAFLLHEGGGSKGEFKAFEGSSVKSKAYQGTGETTTLDLVGPLFTLCLKNSFLGTHSSGWGIFYAKGSPGVVGCKEFNGTAVARYIRESEVEFVRLRFIWGVVPG